MPVQLSTAIRKRTPAYTGFGRPNKRARHGEMAVILAKSIRTRKVAAPHAAYGPCRKIP